MQVVRETLVRVAGLGVAGSALSLFLSRRGIRVEAFDPAGSYPKPCGDAVSLRPWIKRLLDELDVIVTGVRDYVIMVDDEPVSSVSYSSDNWAIVRKHDLVQKMKSEAERLGARIIRASTSPPCACAGNCLCVDARGPYRHPRDTWVLTLRHLLRLREPWNPGEALIDFLPARGGLYWVFPASDDGRIVNVGAGWLGGGVREARTLSVEKSRRLLGAFELIDERAAPIAVLSRIAPLGEKHVRIGEAAGLVMSTSGEGNRPGLESARALAEALEKATTLEGAAALYEDLVSPLVSEARASRIGLGIAMSYPRLFKTLAPGLPREFWRDYLSSRLTLEKASIYMFMLPAYVKRGADRGRRTTALSSSRS